MNFGRSFTYMFRQRDWIGKVLVGGLLLLVPILGWLLVSGYIVRVVRNAAHLSEQLPEWNDWGELLRDGLILFVGGLIYGVPGALLSRMGDFGGFFSSIWGIVVAVVLPAAIIRYSLKKDLGAFFDFKEIFAFIRENLSDYIVVILASLLAYVLASFGVILLVIGVVFTIFWATLVSGHLYGSLAAKAGLPARIE